MGDQQRRQGDHLEVQVHVVGQMGGEQRSALAAIAAELMACKRCTYTMRRGTQCPRCGAWCR